MGSRIQLPAANFHHIRALRENYQLLFTSFHKSKDRLVSKRLKRHNPRIERMGLQIE